MPRVLGLAVLLALLLAAGGAGAQTPALQQPSSADYADAQFVQVSLGFPIQEAGVRLVEGQLDGATEALSDGSARRALANQVGEERFFYFDVHDTYVNGGLNKVIISIAYLDRGLTPIYLDYDSFDTLRPDSAADAVIKKRVVVTGRTNGDAWRTATVTLEDARFANHQPGGADFRIGAGDELILRNVSVLRVSHEKPMPPIRVIIDGAEVKFDVLPMIDPVTNRTLVPMRAMFNALGISNDNISWDQASRTAEARKGQTVITLTIDSAVALVNYVPVPLDQPAVIQADRTLVPLRFVSEQFGLNVQWNPELRVITLTTRPPAPPPLPGPTLP